METPIRSLLALVLVVIAAAMLSAVPARAASSGYGTTPHVSCSYPGAPDCNMGPPTSGGGGCGMSCGGNTGSSPGGCLNITTFPSIVPQISPTGCGSPSSAGNCLNVTTFPTIVPQITPSGCGGSTSPPVGFGAVNPNNFNNATSNTCTSGQVPANQIGIASSVCVNPNSTTSSGGPPPLQTKSCPGYAQQFPIAQSCPVPLPSSNACDIGIRTSLDAAPDTTVSQACGTNQSSSSGTPCPGSPGITYTNDMTACPHDLCSGGLLAYPGPCASCNYGTAVSAANCAQCPGGTGTYGGPDLNAAGCPQGTYCPVDGGTAYAPTACQTCPGGTGFYLKDASNCPKPPPAPSAAAGCGGSSLLLLPSMDLRVGDGPFVCVNCFLPGATTGTLMSSGDCILAGGSWGTDASSGGNTSSSSTSGGAAGTGATQDFENQCIAVFGPFGCASIDLGMLNACVKSKPSSSSQVSNALVACGAQQGAIPVPGTDIPNAGG